MNSHNRKKLKRAIRELVLAEIANSWKGGSHPEDMPIIEDNLRQARMSLDALILRLENKGTEP